MLALGIDPGLATTGYGFVRENDDGSIESIEFGVISTPPKKPLDQRLLQIYCRLQELVHLHKPDIGAVEMLFFQKNVRTAMAVGQARGVILLSFAQENVKVAEYSPLAIKQAITGYGGASKSQMQHMVRALLELDDIPRPDDAADALAVAICHINSSRMSNMVMES
jgi:crossover junction endodeoxyribonuclease RuvC